MSQTPLIGALRVQSAREPRVSAASASESSKAAPSTTTQAAEPDPYFARLVKLVPAEVLALYVALKVAAEGFPGIWAFICLLLVLLVRTIGTKQAGKPVQWIAVAVAAVSFVFWVYATGGHFLIWELPASPENVAKNARGAVSVAIGVWTFAVPYFYKGE